MKTHARIEAVLILLAAGLSAQTPPASPPPAAAGTPATAAADGEAYVKTWQPPIYPPGLKAEKIQGEVTVVFIVDETGSVKRVYAAKSSDPRLKRRQWILYRGFCIQMDFRAGGRRRSPDRDGDEHALIF